MHTVSLGGADLLTRRSVCQRWMECVRTVEEECKRDGEEEEKERVTEEQMDGFRAFTEMEGGC